MANWRKKSKPISKQDAGLKQGQRDSSVRCRITQKRPWRHPNNNNKINCTIVIHLSFSAVLMGNKASADSPSFWQIGINGNKNFEGRHIATGLVSMLKADILKKRIVPYYGTSFSNLASQHVAAKAGFEVAWVELITERMEY